MQRVFGRRNTRANIDKRGEFSNAMPDSVPRATEATRMTAKPRARKNAMPPEKLSFGTHEDYAGHHLTECYHAYVQLLTAKTHSKLMSLNLTQWRTLQFIRYNPGRTQRALADAAGVDPSSMTPIIDYFERYRWVRRKKSKVNRSAYGIEMTDSGLKAYDLIHIEILNTEKRISAVLGAKEAKELTQVLARLTTGLTEAD